MSSESENTSPFRELRWSDILAWAGEKATAQGMQYQDEERVKEIKCTQEGGLVALVEGTKTYYAEVSLKNGKLSSVCTCPAELDCKHGVATLLEYLELAEQGEEVPLISEEALNIARVEWKEKGQSLEPGYFKLEEAAEFLPQDLRKHLEQLTKQELIDILMVLIEKPEKTEPQKTELQKTK